EAVLNAIFRADFNYLWTSKPGIAEDQIEVRGLFDARLNAVAKFVHDVALAFPDLSKIDTDWAGMHSIIGGAPREVGDPAACHYRLRRSASLIDACSAHMFALDESGVHPGCSKCCRERCTSLP